MDKFESSETYRSHDWIDKRRNYIHDLSRHRILISDFTVPSCPKEEREREREKKKLKFHETIDERATSIYRTYLRKFNYSPLLPIIRNRYQIHKRAKRDPGYRIGQLMRRFSRTTLDRWSTWTLGWLGGWVEGGRRLDGAVRIVQV